MINYQRMLPVIFFSLCLLAPACTRAVEVKEIKSFQEFEAIINEKPAVFLFDSGNTLTSLLKDINSNIPCYVIYDSNTIKEIVKNAKESGIQLQKNNTAFYVNNNNLAQKILDIETWGVFTFRGNIIKKLTGLFARHKAEVKALSYC